MKTTGPISIPSSPNSQARSRLFSFMAGHIGILAACLILAMSALSQSARAQVVVLDDNFNDPNNNIGINTNGIGSGFSTFVQAPAGQDGFTYATETNGTASLSSSINGAQRESICSIDGININSAGTKYELLGVTFTNQPNNTAGPNTDRLFVGIIDSSPAQDWLESGSAGLPNGFWLQINSDDYATSVGAVVNNAWADHNTVLYYKSSSGAGTPLYTFQFDNLGWTGNTAVFPQGTNFSPVLNITLTLTATAVQFSITGDTQGGGSPITFSNTFANLGINPGDSLFSGLSASHIGAEDQTEGPGIIMSIDRVRVTQLGNLIVGTPSISTPEYGFNTNTVFAGETVNLSCPVETVPAGGTPVLQWQFQDTSAGGTVFTNIPGATSTNLSLNTAGYGDSIPRGVCLLATFGGITVTSSIVNIAINPSSAPVLFQDVAFTNIQISAGSGVTLSSIFTGNKPFSFQWVFSSNSPATTTVNIPKATNDVFTLAPAALTNTGFYQLLVSNSFGTNSSSIVFIDVIPPAPIFPLAGSYGALALSNDPVGFWMLNETNDPSTGFLQAFDFTGNGHTGLYGTTSLAGFNGILSPQPPTFPGFANNQGALQTTGPSGTNSVVVVPPLNMTYTNTNSPDATICMWINPSSRPNTASGLFFWRNLSGSDAAGFGFSGSQTPTSTSLAYNWNNAQGSWGYNSPLFPPINTWSFVALVVQSNRATMYLNYIDPNTGLPFLAMDVHSNTQTAETFTGGLTWIGGDMFNITSTTPGANRIFPGLISGVAFYQSALSTSQIQQMFGAGIGTNAFAPDINPEPAASITSFLGWTVQMSAGISGTGPLTNHWQLNGTNLVDGTFGGAIVKGSQSNVLTIANVNASFAGTYVLAVSNSIGSALSSSVSVTVSPTEAPPTGNLVGQWLAQREDYTDTSGFSPAGTHDGIDTRSSGGTRFFWTNDVPPYAPAGSESLHFNNGSLTIKNSSTLDAGYTSTYDAGISNAMSITFWAKGWPGAWNPFVSKYGEGPGWQVRNDGNNNVSPCWTLRGGQGTATLGTAVFGNSEDLAATSLTYGNDGLWHYYAATYDVSVGERDLYVDGALVAQVTGEGQYNLAPTEHLVLGGKDSPPGNTFGNFFTGQLYDVRIYNVALDAGQQAFIGLNSPQQLPAEKPALGAVKMPPAAGNAGKFVLSWDVGRLLQSTNLNGPWTTVAYTSPFTNTIITANTQVFFKVINP